ncbi:MAG: TIGR02281 family clan AA aspartic protease [Gammaproteobacteria bacterium]|nr:MAG: TIGR02281 family clan AA aspartic protease [Gammaproteobacteria bacterium]
MYRLIARAFLLLLLCAPAQAEPEIAIIALFRNAVLARIDGKEQMLRAGETTAQGVRLIAADSKEAVLEFEGVRRTYTLNAAISDSYQDAQTPHTVTIAPDAQGIYWVNGSIKGFQVKFLVDTGATLISMNRTHARRLNLDFKHKGEPAISKTASGDDEVYVVMLDKVMVGDIQVRDVRAAVHDSEFPDEILLGNSFLQQVSMHREGALMTLSDRF